MKHLNGNMLAVVDVETTGLQPRYHDIIDICVLPLNKHLEPLKEIMPFNMTLAPKRPENFDPSAFKIRKYDDRQLQGEGVVKAQTVVYNAVNNGYDAYDAADRFVEWFESIGLAGFKRLMPIAHNWIFDYQFMEDWLTRETMEYCFDPRYRDVMSLSLFENDVAEWRGNPFPYAKNNLPYLCTTLNVDRGSAHNALDDCIATARVMKRMIQST